MDVVDIKKERLYAIFYHTSDGVVIINYKNRRVVDLNPAAREMLGWKRDEKIGEMLCDEIFSCYDTEGKEICEVICPVLNLKDDFNIGHTEINILKKEKGPLLPARCVNLPSSNCSAIIIQDIKIRRELEEQLIEETRRDHLTGLYNRQYFEESYNREVRILNKRGGLLTVVLIKIDNLRVANSTFGVKVGNEVLKNTGEIISDTIRKIDIAGRYSGNKFAILLLDTPSSGAKNIIKRLRQNIEEFNTRGKLPIQIKVKIGISSKDREYERLLEEAEDALY